MKKIFFMRDNNADTKLSNLTGYVTDFKSATNLGYSNAKEAIELFGKLPCSGVSYYCVTVEHEAGLADTEIIDARERAIRGFMMSVGCELVGEVVSHYVE